MQARGVNQTTLAARAAIAVSRVNNYLRGNYRTIKPAHLAAICNAVSSTAADTAALAEAYLFDLLPESCRGLVEVRMPGAAKAGKWDVPTKGLPTGFAAALRDLYVLCVANPKVRERTAEWVRIMRETKG